MSNNGKYELEAESLFQEVFRLAFEETNWTLTYDKNGIKFYSTKTSYCQTCPCYKLETVINMSPERIMDTINPFGPYRREYDTAFVDVTLLEEISNNIIVAYKRFQPKLFGFGLRAGDAIDVIVYDKTDKFHYAIHKGIEYDNFNQSFGHRTHSYPTGLYAIRTEKFENFSDPNISQVVVIWHVDVNPPKIVPSIIVDKISCSSVLKNIENLKTMANHAYQPLGPGVPFCRHRKQ